MHLYLIFPSHCDENLQYELAFRSREAQPFSPPYDMSLVIVLIIHIFILASTTEVLGDGSLWTSWIPLAVRSPYLSTWMNTTNVPLNVTNVTQSDRAPGIWAQFLNGQVSGIVEPFRDPERDQILVLAFSYRWTRSRRPNEVVYLDG